MPKKIDIMCRPSNPEQTLCHKCKWCETIDDEVITIGNMVLNIKNGEGNVICKCPHPKSISQHGIKTSREVTCTQFRSKEEPIIKKSENMYPVINGYTDIQTGETISSTEYENMAEGILCTNINSGEPIKKKYKIVNGDIYSDE